ncbi:MAG: hypothetical protein ACOZF2_17745 [Thermodesulfobacteriota bacterium]
MRKLMVWFLALSLALSALAGAAVAKEKFYGVVKQMPKQGYVGQWQVDNRTIYVVTDSKVDDRYAKPAVGGWVKVEGIKVDGKLYVYELEAAPTKK